MISRPGWQCFVFVFFTGQKNKWSQLEVWLRRKKKSWWPRPTDSSGLFVSFFFFFFPDVRKPGWHNVIMYLSIVEQPDMWVWLRSFILFLNQCNLPAVQYPPSPQASVTFHFYSSWTNCCWAWFLISAWLVSSRTPKPFNLHCKCFNDRPCLFVMWEWALKLGWVFLRFCTKKMK